jgi:uncharacterized protein YfaA (DUF2138 family)
VGLIKIISLSQLSDEIIDKMLFEYEQKFKHTGSISMSTRKDGLVSVFSNKGKMLFDDQGNEQNKSGD